MKPSFDDQNRFIMPDYQQAPPFSSFLPGIAGLMGMPLWVFYVNRGQAITSFGVESKDHPIVEFQPANKAYQNTSFTGFRTFLKMQRGNRIQTYEPFSPWQSTGAGRRMFIGMNELELRETNSLHGLQISVQYFTLPGENFAGLVRCLTIQNTDNEPLQLEILDGLPAIIPFGTNNFQLKEFSRTIEAWMEVFNLEHDLPFYRVRASIEDKPEVETFEAGHFALAFLGSQQDSPLLPSFVDPEVVFGQNTAFSAPDEFYKRSLGDLIQSRQMTTGKTPCGFFGTAAQLASAQSVTIYSLYGHISSLEILNQEHTRWVDTNYLNNKRQEARRLAADLTDVIATQTASPLFDSYCRQTFLDNVLRGGWPVLLDRNHTPYHIYSRKHGDPERDYNAFFLAAEFYSQGNGNYRDVNQNRRSDVFFNPAIQAHNIHTFMNLIQADGYNPLVVRGSQFILLEEKRSMVLELAEKSQPLTDLVSRPFNPGKLLKTIVDHKISLQLPPQEFLAYVIEHSQQVFQADFGEGYWVDHWTYNLDLIESYLAIYPERKANLLFTEKNSTFYDSFAFVNPRRRKYQLTSSGPRQLDAVWEDPAKETLIAARETDPHLLRIQQGKGTIYRTNLFSKLFILALLKFATLDPGGMGIEIEAGKPGWYDALNGLPALFGASMPETFELKRLLHFLLQTIEEQDDFETGLPVEVCALLDEVGDHLRTYCGSDAPERDHIYWDQVSNAREEYRQKIRLGFDGAEKSVDSPTLANHMRDFLDKVNAGIARAQELNHGLPPTYFIYQVEAYGILPPSDNHDDRQIYIEPKSFIPLVLPLFLEGFVRALKVSSTDAASELYQQVRASQLFDCKLGMYKVNASLAKLPQHIGRARAFTPGWLENESIWLHMEYKYLLEILKAGLYTEFFEDFKQTLIPFQDPQVYRRSPLENSSFLVSSAHPDEKLHGAGFVARLSGSTAEFLEIWQRMMTGGQPFLLQEGELHLRFAPILPGWLFDSMGRISFKFLGCCTVTYHNPQKWDTFKADSQIQKIHIHQNDGQLIKIHGDTIGAPIAAEIRTGKYSHIEVFFTT